MPTDKNGFISFDDLDPEVAGTLGQGQKRQASRGKSRRAQRQAGIDARRNRRMIDIPEDLEAHLEEIASQLSIPVSQLIARLVWEGLEHVTLERLQAELQPTRSMRYAFTLPYPGKGKKSRSK